MLTKQIVIIYFWLFLIGAKIAYTEHSIASAFKLNKMFVLEKKNVILFNVQCQLKKIYIYYMYIKNSQI